MYARPFLFLLLLLGFAGKLQAQENEHVFVEGRRYMELNIRSLNKYAKRIERTQKHLLNTLKRKEQRLAKKLLRTDSAAYVRLKSQPLSFDSISKLATHPDSSTFAAKSLRGGRKAVDSLKGVYQFLKSKAGKVAGTLNNNQLDQAAGLAGYDQQLNGLQQRLSYDQYINELTNKQALNLQGIAGNNSNTMGIQKDVYYAKSKMNEWKKLADDPSKAEALALEYLQGTKGFDGTLDKALNGGANSTSGATSVDELEKAGFQTKKMMNTMLQAKFGNNLEVVQGNVGKEVSAWQNKAQGLQGDIKETKQSISSLKKTEKPKFKINPERGKPFWQRIEKQYSFNTSRATALTDGTNQPALLTLAASAAYKHTPQLSTGIGLAGNLGLGQNLSNIRFTFEGIGFRSFLTWELQYGIGTYVGYERTYKKAVFSDNKEVNRLSELSSTHNTQNRNESILIGLSKRYQINKKWSGAIQVLYDVWYAEKGLRSPIVLRFVNSN